jgi:hypothetical protein
MSKVFDRPTLITFLGASPSPYMEPQLGTDYFSTTKCFHLIFRRYWRGFKADTPGLACGIIIHTLTAPPPYPKGQVFEEICTSSMGCNWPAFAGLMRLSPPRMASMRDKLAESAETGWPLLTGSNQGQTTPGGRSVYPVDRGRLLWFFWKIA